jgi:DtxR family Mn-dependent transcriptional regulator
MTSEAVDDYLKAIYRLTQEGGLASTGSVAAHLLVAPGSVTAMVQRLAGQDPPLVEYSKSRGVALTDAGRVRALEVIRHHRLLETFLHEALGVPWDRVHEEAERLEHYISEDLEDRIAEFLGHPEIDVHGSPIPRRNGSIPDPARVALADLAPGARCRLVWAPSRDPGLEDYLAGLGLVPGAEIILESVEPFGGPVYVWVGGRRHGLGVPLARRLLVIPSRG